LRFFKRYRPTTINTNDPPQDWGDKDGWDRYFRAELEAGRTSPYPHFVVLRFLSYVQNRGGRVWFPGCGLDPYPRTYAEHGCHVLATDFSPVAVSFQNWIAEGFREDEGPTEAKGVLVVAEHDFVQNPIDEKFDVVINCSAFDGLSPDAMLAAARHFHAALRTGGACLIDTLNTRDDQMNLMEDSLLAAGFFVPHHTSKRWYREQLEATGIGYGMVLGHPHVLAHNKYPRWRYTKFAERDQKILNGLHAQYLLRCQDEADKVQERMKDPTTIVARIIGSSG